MWMKKAEFGLGNKTIVGSCSNSLRNTNPRGIHHRKLMGALPLVYNHKGSVCIGPLNPLCIGIWDIEGYWITPCDLSDSIS